jgi:hypothetical protein
MEHAWSDAFTDSPDLDSSAGAWARTNYRACAGPECPFSDAHSASAGTCGFCGPCAETTTRSS